MDPIVPTRQSETTGADGAPRPHERPVASPGPAPGLIWTAIAAHAVVAGLTQALWLSYAPIATDVAARYDVSVGAVGWLTTVFPLLYVVLAIPAGLALDRWPRRTMAIGAGLVVAGAVLRFAWEGFAGALGGQVLVSLAQPILLGGVAVIASSLLPASRRAIGIAVGSAGVFAGLLVGIAMPTAFGADHLPALLGAQAAMSVLGVVVLVGALHRLGQRAMATNADLAPGLAALRTLLADPVQRTLLTLAAGGFGAFVALLTWLQALLEPRGIDEDTSGVLLLVLVLAGFVGTAFLPALAARRRKEARMLFVALPIATIAGVVLAAGPSVAVTAVALAVIGAALLPALPVMLELAEQRADATADERTAGVGSGSASALLWLSGNLGGFAAALVVGATLDDPAIGFGLIAALTLVIGATAG
ncbi:MAG: MFS transporter, partial [Solirubrobacteraceae bacterium]|nr:MFS transporter [Solirubrobacteraceae bacterium]